MSKNDELRIKNAEICIKNEEFCIKNEEICIKNDDFCRSFELDDEGHPVKGGRSSELQYKYKWQYINV